MLGIVDQGVEDVDLEVDQEIVIVPTAEGQGQPPDLVQRTATQGAAAGARRKVKKDDLAAEIEESPETGDPAVSGQRVEKGQMTESQEIRGKGPQTENQKKRKMRVKMKVTSKVKDGKFIELHLKLARNRIEYFYFCETFFVRLQSTCTYNLLE